MRGITIKIDGKKRRLRYDSAAFYRASEKMSKTIGPELSVRDLSLILWAGLIHEDPGLSLGTIEKTVKASSPKSLKVLQKKIEKALEDYIRTLNRSIKDVSKIKSEFDKQGKMLDALNKKI